MKKISLIALVVLTMVFFSCDIGNNPSTQASPVNPFVGTWTFQEKDSVNDVKIWLTFYDDGTFNFISEYYYSNDWSSEFDGKYTYDENEVNFVYIYDNRRYDEFQRYKFYEGYLRLWGEGGYIPGNNYIKSETIIQKKIRPMIRCIM
jgi:hypothetical protein